MGRTSSAVKDRYNAKAYDEMKVRVAKGNKERIQAHAEAQGESLNAFIHYPNTLILRERINEFLCFLQDDDFIHH